jgi:GAF domain
MERESSDFVKKVQQDTDSYIRDLLATLQSLRATNALLEADRARLEGENDIMREDLERRQQEADQLRVRLDQISLESQESLDRYQAVAAQNASLANLYVATYRLHGTVDREDVLAGMQEVIGNLIGCEEVAVYEIVPGARELLLAWSFGLAPDRGPVRLGEGAIGGVAATGVTFVAGAASAPPAADERHLSACVPLKVKDDVIAVLALFRLLPQKSGGLTELDYEILNLLETHGATAFYLTQLHDRYAGTAAQPGTAARP